jgi:Fe-S cluster assembly iron-binding protein IscA
MLVLTENARSAVQALTADAPGEAGLRIATGQSSNGGNRAVFTLSVTAGPHPEDAVLDEAGARVFLEPGAATMLDAQTLDAEMDNAKQVSFFVR